MSKDTWQSECHRKLVVMMYSARRRFPSHGVIAVRENTLGATATQRLSV
jgi:hypothetical protein